MNGSSKTKRDVTPQVASLFLTPFPAFDFPLPPLCAFSAFVLLSPFFTLLIALYWCPLKNMFE